MILSDGDNGKFGAKGSDPPNLLQEDEKWMRAALEEARRAVEEGEVPVGAVAVKDGVLIGKGYNQVESLNDATAHAEMIAITAASNALRSWRLDGVTLYVTLEPCPMCAGAILLSRVGRLVFAAKDPRLGACGSVSNLFDGTLNHKVQLNSGVLEEEASNMLKDFFQELRE
ncbi:MAG: tRNA adenosine(34) deaminase TadA [Candidatus Eisenbacteria bacterium]|nr:tRNA adenosine(34) deaminase TadA [Candidatus Eisenbacteria bacterium]